MSAQDGGAAFPTLARWKDDTMNYINTGMTMRDYFAAKAMAGMIGGTWPDLNDRAEIGRRAYAMADAMLAARKEQPK